MNNSNYFQSLVDLVVSGRISTYSSLKEYIVKNSIKVSKLELDIIFSLIKKLYWGTFSDLNFDEYTDLWRALVIPDQKYPSLYGDLKKIIILPNLFISLLDIHGYTAFCQKTRRNVNSLHRLDKFVENTIKNTTKKYGVIARRERGDEVILIGADAVDIINATFDVINLFSKRIELVEVDQGEEPFLPPFEISGGIVGGYKTTPLVIGEKGDLQGILINLAARLQTRANTISPTKTKIVIDQSTYHKFISSNKPRSSFVKSIKFLFNGEIEFKGGRLKVFEIYYRDDEKYKDLIYEHIRKLTEKIDKGDWQVGVISTLCDLGIVVSDNIPKFSKTIELYHDGEVKVFEVTNDFISSIFLHIKYAITNSRDFSVVVKRLGFLVEVLENVEEFDQIVKDYCKSVYKEYLKIFYEYDKILMTLVEQNPSDFLDVNEMEIFLRFNSYKEKYDSIIKKINSDPKFLQKRNIVWNRAFNNVRNQISFSIYTGKK